MFQTTNQKWSVNSANFADEICLFDDHPPLLVDRK